MALRRRWQRNEDRFLRHKKELHQQLIAGMDLSAIGTMNEDELRVGGPPGRRGTVPPQLRTCSASANASGWSTRCMDETFGLGPLEPLMRDPTITDILINGPKTVYVERSGRLERADVAFHDERHLLQIVQRIVGRVGRRVDETSRWSTPACPTAAASTPSSRRWPWTAPWSRSAASAPGRS